jgi:hypothetical protein
MSPRTPFRTALGRAVAHLRHAWLVLLLELCGARGAP